MFGRHKKTDPRVLLVCWDSNVVLSWEFVNPSVAEPFLKDSRWREAHFNQNLRGYSYVASCLDRSVL